MAIDDRNSMGDKAGRAASKAVHGHDEPRTKGDIVGESVGGLSGAATGAALGSLGGPIGTIIGGIAGAATGWWTGRAVSEAASSFDGDEDYYRNHFSSRGGTSAGTSAGAGGSLSGSTGGTSGRSLDYDRARPAYQLGHVAGMNPDYRGRQFDDVEVDLRRCWESHRGDDHGRWEDVRDHARTAYDRGQQRHLTLSEEQLAVGTRQVQAGEVELRKTVDTEHVRETVPVRHDEVSIDRQPLSGARAANASIGEETIRVPLTAEEVVADKRVVGTEEVVVRTESVTENRTVEADLRKERLDTTGLDQARGLHGRDAGLGAAGTSGAADRATNSGPLDRLADRADDLKDRVDGDPASRPGPDRTDRRI